MRKLGRTTEQRLAVLRNQASNLLWYGKITTTKENAKEFLLNHPEIMEEVENLLRETINNNTSVSKKDDLDGDD